MLTAPYYYSTIKNYVVAIGSLFNNVHVIRSDSKDSLVKDIKVPLTYAARQHYWAKLKEEHATLGTTMPRMSFMFNGLDYDSERQTNPLNVSRSDSTNNNNSLKQLNSVPYNFNFSVSAYSDNVDDSLQIAEQILPVFTPSYNMTINEIPSMNISRDVAIIMNDVSHEDNYVEGFSTDRSIVWTFELVVRGNLYQPISDAPIIKKTITTVYDEPTLANLLETIDVSVLPPTASKSDPHTTPVIIT